MRTTLIEQLQAPCIPPAVQGALAPATHYLYEWQTHLVLLPNIDRLQVGQTYCSPQTANVFQIRFENQLGLAKVQPWRDKQPVGTPLWVEVISPKFPTPVLHVQFFRTLLADLFAQATQLPLALTGATSRSVAESLRPPIPLFTLHFLCQHASTLRSALGIIQAFPHRDLTERSQRVRLAEAKSVGPDVILEMMHQPETWAPTAQDTPLAQYLHGYAPTHVLQEQSVETFNTPENRFVYDFLRELLAATDELLSQAWWERVPQERQTLIRESASQIDQVFHHPLFDQVGPLRYLPLHSQVLLRREGYRELLSLWQHFQQARQPLFAPLQQAIEVRDIAQLYEMWVFFALIEELNLHFEQEPTITLSVTVEHGLRWDAEADYVGKGTLHYNCGFRRPDSYSLSLRPDFTWKRGGKPDVVLDAKFRLMPLSNIDEEDSPKATAERTDLYKMHTYRDALRVRAAVALYPGTETLFYTTDAQLKSDLTLNKILTQDIAGVGALPLNPMIQEA
jgi:hypothetical protein